MQQKTVRRGSAHAIRYFRLRDIAFLATMLFLACILLASIVLTMAIANDSVDRLERRVKDMQREIDTKTAALMNCERRRVR